MCGKLQRNWNEICKGLWRRSHISPTDINCFTIRTERPKTREKKINHKIIKRKNCEKVEQDFHNSIQIIKKRMLVKLTSTHISSKFQPFEREARWPQCIQLFAMACNRFFMLFFVCLFGFLLSVILMGKSYNLFKVTIVKSLWPKCMDLHSQTARKWRIWRRTEKFE